MLQVSECQEVVTTKEAPDRTSTQARLEGVLGLSEGHNTAVLSL